MFNRHLHRRARLRCKPPVRGRRNGTGAIGCICDSLESRVLLTIVWENEGSSDFNSPDFNRDNFDTYYQGFAEYARRNVRRAINDWNSVITDFNYSDGTEVFNLSVSAADLAPIDPDLLGATYPDFIVDADGKPRTGRIELDDNGATSGWFTDQVPEDDVEFTNLQTAFAADSPGAYGDDFYSTILHEIGHAIGITRVKPELRINQFMHPTQYTDDSGSPLSLFVVQDTPLATLNADDHVYAGSATVTPPVPVNENDLMNESGESQPTRRYLITNTDVEILGYGYDYSFEYPSSVNTFFFSQNFATLEAAVRCLPDTGNTITTTVDPVRGPLLQVTAAGLTTVEPFNPYTISGLSIYGGNQGDAVTWTQDLPYVPGINISGGDGNDSLVIAHWLYIPGFIDAGPGSDYVAGGSGNDTIAGGPGDDNLFGSGGEDWFYGGTGGDDFDGGDQGDTVDYSDHAQAIAVGMDSGPNDGNASDFRVDGVSLDNVKGTIEKVLGTEANDYIAGSSMPEEFWGRGGIDTLIGNDGDDTLVGNNGNDDLQGVGGNDQIWGDDVAQTSEFGNDTIDGGDGNDGIFGGRGQDAIVGGFGADWLDGGPDSDTVTYTYWNNNPQQGGVYVTVGFGNDDGFVFGENDDVRDTVETVKGTEFNDHLIGNAGINALYGMGRNDTLTGNGGDDWLFGDGGDDGIWGDTEGVYNAYGYGGADNCYGGDGNDTLIGGGGVDRLYGGANADVYWAQDGNSDYVNKQSEDSWGSRDTSPAEILL